MKPMRSASQPARPEPATAELQRCPECPHRLAEHYATGCGWCICKVTGSATEDADQAPTAAAFGSMPKDGSMTIGDGVDGRPYISDPIRERIAMAEPTYTRNPDGVDLIAQERRRQIDQEGYSPEHDSEHADGALVKAAVTYAREALWAVQHPDVEFDPTLALTIRDHQGTPASTWPWDAKWWKPNADPVLNLVKAGALIAAEIDRLVAARQVELLPAPEFTDGT